MSTWEVAAKKAKKKKKKCTSSGWESKKQMVMVHNSLEQVVGQLGFRHS